MRMEMRKRMAVGSGHLDQDTVVGLEDVHGGGTGIMLGH